MAAETPAPVAASATRTVLLLAASVACSAVLVVGAVLAAATPTPATLGSAAPTSLVLPRAVAGLDVDEDSASGANLDRLAERLTQDPAVAAVQAGAYRGDGVTLVVLLLVPERPLDEQTAGRLTTEVLGAVGGRRGMSSDFRSETTTDGEALVTCSMPDPATATCVAVEADQALLVMVSGQVTDPVATTALVRDDVVADRSS